MDITLLPTVNAVLNSTCTVLLVAGFFFIRRNNVSAHRACMVAAFTTSVLFLISYLTYHYYHGATGFQGTGWVRPLYFAILITHTFLAALIVPFVLVTLYRALKTDFARHKRVARWTLPMWLYVSVTGVVVYLMLYYIYPSRP
ncbi:MAG TPA: DUF420 domain-containing protein [Blastocatellia bacterium]|jgi:putative membrane protein|nr:DUF420 domain-containing protein [Blastocatellia bacterium]